MTATRQAKKKISRIFRFRRITGLAFLVLLLACGGQSNNHNPNSKEKIARSELNNENQPVGVPSKTHQEYVRHEVLVRFKAGTAAETIERIQKELKLERLRKFSTPHLYLMKITDGSSVEEMINRLNNYQSVKYAEPNYVVKAHQ
jgi:Fervidolysin N-terminal prodomain